MQNYNAPPGQPAYGAPPPAKQGLSKGCIIGIVVAAVLGLALLVVLAATGGLLFFMQSSGGGGPVNVGVNSPGSGSSTTAGDEGEAEEPQPTSAQTAAVSGGQAARWEQQEIEWTVPQRWAKQQADSRMMVWRSPGSSDAVNLIANVSPMGADFPTDVSTKATYDQAATRKANGEVSEYKYLKLNGVKGVMFRESSPESDESPQRLQWIGYRDYKGQKQMLNVMLSTRGKDFARHEDTMYGVLYTTKF